MVAHSKHTVTTLEITFIRFFVSCMTLSTLVKVAAFPTVWSLTVNCSLCTNVGTLSRFSRSSFFCAPPGTWITTVETPDCTSTVTYLITELSDDFIQPIGFFSEIFSLCEKVLSGFQRSFTFRKLVHGKRHRGHVFSSFYYIIVFLQVCVRTIAKIDWRKLTSIWALLFSCHFSVSASISLVASFISSPDLAIFSCSSVSSLTAFRGFVVVPCFYNTIQF